MAAAARVVRLLKIQHDGRGGQLSFAAFFALEYRAITARIIGFAIDVHRTFRSGPLEEI
jgi:hypothetical protein